MASHDQIKDYAYQLWVNAGRPVGQDKKFWHAAEVELNAGDKDPDAASSEQQPNPKTVPG